MIGYHIEDADAHPVIVYIIVTKCGTDHSAIDIATVLNSYSLTKTKGVIKQFIVFNVGFNDAAVAFLVAIANINGNLTARDYAMCYSHLGFRSRYQVRLNS